MAYYEQGIIDQVAAANDIVDVVSSYIQLKKKGNTHWGLCPFHNEKTPSFSVDQRKQMFYCFGCHKGGGVIHFVMEMEDMPFPEALESLADKARIELPKQREQTEEERRAQKLKGTLYDIYRDAALYYHQKLWAPEGEKGLEYFRKRQLSDAIIKHFGLGYAPLNGGLYEFLKEKGYPQQLIIKSDLVRYSEKDGFRDYFWNRVMFPIMDDRRRVIAFGGRVLGEGEPKYLNSKESEIFIKRNNFYGMCFAKKSRKKGIILCEGYMDVIAMHQAGFDNAVAALGTAFTEEHANLLPRYAEDGVYICFDSDTAGRKAAMKAIPMIRARNLPTKVLRLEPHKDPDEFIKAKGLEEFTQRVMKADNSFLFEMEYKRSEYDINDPSEKSNFENMVANEIATRFRDAMTRENYIAAASQRFDIIRDNLRRTVNEIGEKLPINAPVQNEPEIISKREERRENAKLKRQKLLLHYMADYPALYPQIKDILSPEDFGEEFYVRVARILYQQLSEGRSDPQAILGEFTEDEAGKVSEIFCVGFEEAASEQPESREEIEKGVGQLVHNLKEESLKNQKPAEGTSGFAKSIEDKKLLDTISKRKFTIA